MPVRLNGSTSGYTELTAAAAAANNTLTLPSGNGSSGQILSSDGAGNLSWVERAATPAPATATSTGRAGQVAYDSSYIYVCTATNTWRRALLSSW